MFLPTKISHFGQVSHPLPNLSFKEKIGKSMVGTRALKLYRPMLKGSEAVLPTPF